MTKHKKNCLSCTVNRLGLHNDWRQEAAPKELEKGEGEYWNGRKEKKNRKVHLYHAWRYDQVGQDPPGRVLNLDRILLNDDYDDWGKDIWASLPFCAKNTLKFYLSRWPNQSHHTLKRMIPFMKCAKTTSSGSQSVQKENGIKIQFTSCTCLEPSQKVYIVHAIYVQRPLAYVSGISWQTCA